MTTTPRFVLDEKRIAIHDTERDLYYGVMSIKTARLFTHRFNEGYDLDVVDDVDEWQTNDDADLNTFRETDDTLFDLSAVIGVISPDEIAIGEGN